MSRDVLKFGIRGAIFLCAIAIAAPALSFCGFYVARADGSIYNQGSKVVYVHVNETSVITMGSDYQGPASEFALIVPTPSVLNRDQVRTVSPKTVNHLDGYSAPRLTEYFDSDPCENGMVEPMMVPDVAYDRGAANARKTRRDGARALGVKIQAEYAVGDYDIVMLSAKQSNGLETWLLQEGYKLPKGASAALQPYIDMGMKFFVARVNLSRHDASKAQDLQPLQIRFRSKNFMLPIQLGKLNGDGPQDLVVLTLTRKGKVELSNYVTHEIPSQQNIPVFVKDMFPAFYNALFAKAAHGSAAFMEYAWDMSWCDPCADDPLSYEEFAELGVPWVTPADAAIPNVFLTRLHIRYDRTTFFEDLKFHETDDRTNFQGIYYLNHPFEGQITCEAGKEYVAETRKRLQDEANTLQALTNWNAGKIAKKIRQSTPPLYR